MKSHRTHLRNAFVILAVAFATYLSLGYRRAAPESNATIASAIEAPVDDARILKPIDHVEFEHVPLSDVLLWVADISGLKLNVDWSGLDEVDWPTPNPQPHNMKGMLIDLQLKHVNFAAILDAALFAADPKGGPGWSIKNGIITVAPQYVLETEKLKMADTNPVVRVYDVHALIAKVTRSTSIETYNGIYQTGGQSQYQQSPAYGPWTDDRNAVDEICKYITDNVDSPSWKDNGGDVGTITQFGSMLSIEQTPQAHREIERRLRRLHGGL